MPSQMVRRPVRSIAPTTAVAAVTCRRLGVVCRRAHGDPGPWPSRTSCLSTQTERPRTGPRMRVAMDDRPLRDQSMHPEIAQLFAGTKNRPPPDRGVVLELCVVQPPPDEDSQHTQPDTSAEAERLQVVRIDARRHLILVLDSHRRRADALAAIYRDGGPDSFAVREFPSPIP